MKNFISQNGMKSDTANSGQGNPNNNNGPGLSTPQINLPKGGGAIKGIEEKFKVNAANGTASMSIPLPLSASRGGHTPSVSLTYNSGTGNSTFGLGWGLDVPAIARKTENKLPLYTDDEDTFVLSGLEDLVPLLETKSGKLVAYVRQRSLNGKTYEVKRYCPRIEGAFTRIEKWKDINSTDSYWRTISRDNVHSYYGMTTESRITDPNDLSRTYQWNLSYTHDDKGAISLYTYKPENFAGIPASMNEKNRIHACAQTYLKSVLYGNKTVWYTGDVLPTENDFMFRLVFDYGEHDTATAIPQNIYTEKQPWPCRKDPFSTYRPGFEIRTYRRCQRILLFNCFSTLELPHSPYLVKSLQLSYDDQLHLLGNQQALDGYSFLISAQQNGHMWQTALSAYSTKSLPEMEFNYQAHAWNTQIQTLLPQNAINIPVGINDRTYLWADLYSEGISGILTEQATGWFYSSNLGDGAFAPAKMVVSKPNLSGLTGKVTLQELEGDGSKYLSQTDNEPKGFFKLDDDDHWQPFKNFIEMPVINPSDKNMRSIDLNADGRPDLLITDENAMRWYPNLGEYGFAMPQTVTKALDEEKGPAIVFADPTQSIFLADINGDGLTDIVRIRNGEICYWPNLGYGRFGAKVAMDNAPLFDAPEAFNPSYLRLADIDGSGTMDIIYLGKNSFSVWMNQNGNTWPLAPQVIRAFPSIDNLADVTVVDLLGTGTACIAYSSTAPLKVNTPLQYVDIMGSLKPHLLIGFKNNCGKEVAFEYRSSTKYYLDDKKEGRPWITKLPFPVHCLAKVTTQDKIRETVFVNSYRYSHGYYDHAEKEFRGFARVEQLDTEEFSLFKLNNAKNVVDQQLHQPPIKSISWYHTGAFLRDKEILHQCKSEYFKNMAFTEYELPEPIVDSSLNAVEYREAVRALKGLLLRTEVYAVDGSSVQADPYSASESTVEIRMLQPITADSHNAVFLTVPSESIAYGYERNPIDPKISHTFVLDVDELGGVKQSASLVYKRISRPLGADAIPDEVWAAQSKVHILTEEALYTDEILQDDIYRRRIAYESMMYEIGGIDVPAGTFISKGTLLTKLGTATTLNYEEEFTSGVQKRLSTHSRTYLFKDDLSGPALLGKMTNLAIAHKTYQLAFTPNLVTQYYGSKVNDMMLANAGYVHSNGDNQWWAPSGVLIYDVNPDLNFYTPIGSMDIFGNQSFIAYDSYTLLPTSTTDAIGNQTISQNDYRVLATVLLKDANNNRSAVDMDELGIVTRSAVMGKLGAGEGDTLADPTARMEYDLFNWKNNQKPNYIHAFAREQHGTSNPRWQENYTYTDGSGSVIMTKSQVAPGKAKRWNPVTKTIDDVPANPRWRGNGRTVMNNKGNPIKQYEPYFSSTFDYESEAELVETGISPILYYDPLGRNIRTEYPNGTFSKVEFDAWYSRSFDMNDTVKDSQWYIDRGSPNPITDPEPANQETRAAWLAAKHYDTPSTNFTDNFGRTIYSMADLGGGSKIANRTESGITGRYCKSYDPLNRMVAEGYTNILGASIYGRSAEKGECWEFVDAMGQLLKVWDNGIQELRTEYDSLHRPVSSYVKRSGTEIVHSHIVYGDGLSNAVAMNLKGKAYQLYDQAGAVTIKEVDFKGTVTKAERRLAIEYKQDIDWGLLNGLATQALIDAAANTVLESESFVTSALVDALGRPMLVNLPDASIIKTVYDEGNTLKTLQVKVRGAGPFIDMLKGQEYDAKGQRQFAKYGNGLISNYFYDPNTFLLVNLITKTNGVSDTQSHQNLNYVFDPSGNITYVANNALDTFYFKNAVVKAESLYEYDAIYQLIKTSGREHAGLGNDTQSTSTDFPFLNQLPQPNNPNAVRNYHELFTYDDLGNILKVQHFASGGNWVRRYRYNYQDDPNDHTNRLKSTSIPADPAAGPYTDTYQYDQHGNITAMPHLPAVGSMIWNFADQLHQVNLGGGGNAYYVYGAGGNRIRKIIERSGGKKMERIYLGSVEIYREYQGTSKRLERSTVHIADNVGRIAQIDTKVLDLDGTDVINPTGQNLIRFQFHDHLGSSMMETDENGTVISYEEFRSYGTSAYRISKSSTDISLKRYRFSGKEHDDETGFYYFGARYYAAWLGRWTSTDPAGFVSGYNLFKYCSNNPVMRTDPNGMQDHCVPWPVYGDLANGGFGEVGYIGCDGMQHLYPAAVVSPSRSSAPTSRTPAPPAHPRTTTRARPPAPHAPVAPAAPAAPPAAPAAPPAAPAAPAAPADAGAGAGVGAPAAPPAPAGGTSGHDAASAGGPTASSAAAGAERFIWQHYNPFDRGKILEWLFGVPWRSNTKNWDLITDVAVQQVKSTNAFEDIGNITRSATRDAATAIGDNPATMAGRRPQAVIVTPTDAPRAAADSIDSALNPGRGRRIPPGALDPEHVRGLPGRAGAIGRGLTVVGTGLSAYALIEDIRHGDAPMGVGDALSTAGGGLEIYALSTTGATVAGVSAMSAGLVLGGVGIAVTSGVAGYRAYRRGDNWGAAAGVVGVLAGAAIVAGVVFSAPALLVGGLIAAAAVGIFHLVRWARS